MKYRRKQDSRGGRAAVSHADDWLMTYADMITLLLCFFIVFLSMSVPKKAPEAQVQKPQVAEETARPPTIMQGNLPLHGMKVATFRTQFLEEEEPKEETPPPKPEPVVEKRVEAQPAPPPPVKKEEGPKGDRITTLEMNSATFFDVGSATLSEGGQEVLNGVTETLVSDQYRDYVITIEGHTDDAPISTPQFPSNWELSTARAAAVVHYFLKQGIPPQRLRAAGYADTFPKVPNRDEAGNPIPENQAANRRVVIKLEKIVKEEK